MNAIPQQSEDDCNSLMHFWVQQTLKLLSRNLSVATFFSICSKNQKIQIKRLGRNDQKWQGRKE